MYGGDGMFNWPYIIGTAIGVVACSPGAIAVLMAVWALLPPLPKWRGGKR